MSKNQEKFQKAFMMQMKASLKGDQEEASKVRQVVNFYRKKLDRN